MERLNPFAIIPRELHHTPNHEWARMQNRPPDSVHRMRDNRLMGRWGNMFAPVSESMFKHWKRCGPTYDF